VSVALMHHFETKVGSVQDVSPGVDDTTFRLNDRLVKVETIEVECHGAHAKGSEPDANDRPGSQEEVKAAAVIEGGILEEETTEVPVSSDDVIGFFLLTKLVAIVLRFILSWLSNK